jgi:hypothetical protein
MPYPISSDVTAGQPTAASQYNNLRLDLTRIGEPSWQSCGRLTLTTGVPVTLADVTGAGTVYFTPYKGNAISLYDTTYNTWKAHNFGELSISLAGKTINTNYDVFLWENAGNLELVLTAWASDTARSIALSLLAGIYVKSTVLTQRYLGTVRCNGAGTTEDSEANRYLFSHLNPALKTLFRQEATATWTYVTAAWRLTNAAAANSVRWLTGIVENSPFLAFECDCKHSAGTALIGIGIDAVDPVSNATMRDTVGNTITTTLTPLVAVGNHIANMMEWASGATATFYGTTNGHACQLHGTLLC